MAESRPLRTVVAANLREVRGSLLGPDTLRRVRIWHLDLECGHRVERFAKYPPSTRLIRANGWHPRRRDEALPAPERSRCDHCPNRA